MLALGLLGLMLLGSRGSGTRSATFAPNTEAESAACVVVRATRPTRYAGRTQGRRQSTLDWLARVAFHAAYGRWPTTSTGDVARLAVLLTCVSEQTERRA